MDNLIDILMSHPDEQIPLHELRSLFREANQHNIRQQYAGYHPIGWAMIGDPATARDRYTATEWRLEMLRRLDDPCTQDFGLGAVPSALSADLESLAQASLLHDSVTWDDSVSGVTDHDAPACPDVTTMTDAQLCTYIDRAIQESADAD